MSDWADFDPMAVPLPSGTLVSTRHAHEGLPQGAVGRVVGSQGSMVTLRLADGRSVDLPRTEVVPTKLAEARYAVRRAEAWSALRPTAIVETVVGSRAWGLAEADSDVDRRGVFVLPTPWTAGLVSPPSELVSLDGSETFWELSKAVRQALRADPNTLETLFLPDARALDPMGEQLLGIRSAFVSKAIYGSFGRYALSQLKKLQQAMRLSDHRGQVLAWLRAAPAMTLDECAARLEVEAAIEAASPKARRRRAKDYIKQLYASLYDRGQLEARSFSALRAWATDGGQLEDTPRHLRPKNAYNLLRLLATATHWLETGEPRFVLPALRPRLMAIKRGEVPLEEVVAEAQAMVPALDAARARSPLPESPDVKRADEGLRAIRLEAARRWVAGNPGPWGSDAPTCPRPEPGDRAVLDSGDPAGQAHVP